VGCSPVGVGVGPGTGELVYVADGRIVSSMEVGEAT
jgi:hypothetical protein